MEDAPNVTDVLNENALLPKSNDPNFVDIILEKFENSSYRAIVEPPQIEGSTVDDWLHFFIQNAFIFLVWILAMIWVVYVVFYHSRVVGYIVTKIINYLFMKNGYFKIGSLSLASISGKIMFRDLVYVNEDYSLRIQDGWIVFCYWIPYIYRNAKTEDLSSCEDRVVMFLNGFELHVYNRSALYSELEKIFKLPSKLFGEDSDKINLDDLKRQADEERRQKIKTTINKSAAVNELKQSIWRDLIPMTKVEIASGRFVFGNHLIPSTLVVSFEDSSFHYTSRPAISKYDLFTHILKGKADNLQVVLVPSPNYSKTNFQQDEPPRIMGDGFNVFRTNKIDMYYYQDSPGLIMSDEAMEEGDHTPPAWGIVVKAGKGTDFSYGPWADRQRDSLYGFFYPGNFQEIPVNEKPKIGEHRQFEAFDVRFSTMHDAKIDILFTKNRETKALHINAGPGTYLEASIPWICGPEGYTSNVQGQIMRLEATTSLQFRPLLSCETLEVDLKIDYKRYWNAFQDWNCRITSCKATIDLIFAHKIFITELIDDWSEKSRSDIFKFVPYTWRIALVLKEFELLVFANEHNWIDCSTMGAHDENSKIAVCGEHFDLSFDLPFVEYLPQKLAIKIWIQGECLEGAFYLPESTSNRDIIELLQRYSILIAQDGSKKEYLSCFGKSRKWKNIVSPENNWYECMSAPILALSITYDFWPMPVIETSELKISEITTPQLEEIILDPLRPEAPLKNGLLASGKDPREDFDPNSLEADVMTLELEIGSVNIAIFGSLFMLLWNIKENYMGEAQVFQEMSANFFDDKFSQLLNKSEQRKMSDVTESLTPTEKSTFDGRLYRPFEVIVSVSLHSLHGHLVQCTNIAEQYSPVVYIEKLCFELKKGFNETLLQLVLSPAVLQVNDSTPRIGQNDDPFQEGFLILSSLQFRGHALFSNLDRPVESETIEYGWLVEVDVGEVTGRLTSDQLLQVLIPLENFYYQLLQSDIWLQAPVPFKKCLHDRFQNECTQSDLLTNRLCPYSEDLKYKMVRVIVHEIDLYLIESNVALNVNVPNLRLGTCNLHVKKAVDGLSLLTTDVSVKQFVSVSSTLGENDDNKWIEISSVNIGPFFIDSAISSSVVDSFSVSQIDFIKRHDEKFKRLWFLWNSSNACGCVGNCVFFGCNLTGIEYFSMEKSSADLKAKCDKCFGISLHNHSEAVNPLYGESLLHPQSFLLDINSTLIDQASKLLTASKMTTSVLSSQSTSTSDNKTRSKNEFLKAGTWKSKDVGVEKTSLQDINKASKSSILSPSISSTGWASPLGVLSADDLTLNYYTANDTFASGSQQYLSAHASNSTLRKLTSLDSSTPTLVSVEDEPEFKEPEVPPKKDAQPLKHNAATRSSLYFDTISNASFMSAASDFDDLNFVDLRPQLEKPIYESPLLMGSYSTYMSQYESRHLEAPPPFPHYQNERIIKYFHIKSPESIYFERLLYEYRHNWKTKFVLKSAGFSETKIVSKSTAEIDRDFYFRTNFVPGIIAQKFPIQRANESSFLNDSEVLLKQRKPTVLFNVEPRNRTKTSDEESKSRAETHSDLSSVISSNLVREDEQLAENVYFHIQFMEINIKVSPLSLDVISKFLSSAEKGLNNLHPATLLQHASLSCQNIVQDKNALKREKLLYLGQLHMRAWKVLKNRQNMKNLNRSISFSERPSKRVTDLSNQGSVQTLLSSNLNSDRKLSLNLTLDIHRLNVDSVQASLVEEVIKFSYLDRIKNRTCVSLLNISFEKISLNVKQKHRLRKVLHILMGQSSDRSLTFAERALMTRFFTRKTKKTINDIETFAQESCDAFFNEKTINCEVGQLHVQLSRLVNSPEVLSKAGFTVIPFNKTKVDFLALGPTQSGSILRTKRGLYDNRQSISSTTSKRSLQRQSRFDSNENLPGSSREESFEHYNRFIMFEGGLEKISVTFVDNSMLNALKLNPESQASLTLSSSKLNESEVQDATGKDSDSLIVKGEIAKVWFHFASPSKITNAFERNEFTRHDWHLLSSAVPLAIAWISAIDRMSYTFSCLSTNTRHRCLSTLTCLMSKSLNEFVYQEETQVVKPLFSNSKQLIRMFSPMARTFQEDPSIQMVNMLRSSLKKEFLSNEDFEVHFQNRSLVPNSDVLEKGIVVLLLKWKDLMLGTVKSEAPQSKTLFNVTKSQIVSLFEEKTRQLNQAMNAQGDVPLPKTPKPDRSSKLEPLDAAHLDIEPEGSNAVSSAGKEDLENLLDVSSSITKLTYSDIEATKRNRASSLGRRPHHHRVQFVSRSQIKEMYDRFLAFPIVRNLTAVGSSFCYPLRNSVNRMRNRRKDESARDDQELRILNAAEMPNVDTTLNMESVPQIIETRADDVRIDIDEPTAEGAGRESSYSHYGEKKDLYWWMAKVQQDYVNGSRSQNNPQQSNSLDKEATPEVSEFKEYETIPLDDLGNVKEGQELREEQQPAQNEAERPKHSSQEFLNDFSALLACISVKPEFCSTKSTLKMFVSAKISLFCIDIDETETEISRNIYNVNRLNLQDLMSKRQVVDERDSAFVFKNLLTEAVIAKNISEKETSNFTEDFQAFMELDIANFRSNVGTTLKTLDSEGNVLNLNSSLILSFDLELEQVTQRINLPLLRLVHQFSAMYENVVQTRFEMRTNRSSYPRSDLDNQVHEKTSLKSFSSLSSSSDSSSTFTESIAPEDEEIADAESEGDLEADHGAILPSTPSEQREIIEVENVQSIERMQDCDAVADRCWKTVYFLLEQFQTDCNNSFCNYLLHLPEAKNADTIVDLKPTSEFDNADYFDTQLVNNIFGVPLIISGKGRVKKLNLVAMLSNLKLDGDLTNFRFSANHQSLCRKEKAETVPVPTLSLRNSQNSTLEVNLDQTKISLFEDLPIVVEHPSSSSERMKQQLVVQMVIGKSFFSLTHSNILERRIVCSVGESGTSFDFQQAYALEHHREAWNNRENTAKIQIGAIEIDIPQHPIALHSVMTRSGRHLTSTLQELRVSRQPSRLSRQQNAGLSTSNTANTMNESHLGQFHSIASSLHDLQETSSIFHSAPVTPKVIVEKNIQQQDLYSAQSKKQARARAQFKKQRQSTDSGDTSNSLASLVVKFQFTLKSFTIKASLLPSLRAQYQIGQIESAGFTGPKAKFNVNVSLHSLRFNTLVEPKSSADANLPTEASISMPVIQVQAEYTEDSAKTMPENVHNPYSSDPFSREIVLRDGGYLKLVADIGDFKHCLTTDLLNHLLFVQKVFMKEVNEVLQKMARNESSNFVIFPDGAFKTASENSSLELQKQSKSRSLLFSLHLKMTGIQITATTPTNCAVRFETGPINVQLSNRVVDLSKSESNLKFFVRVQLDFNLALGQLIKNYIFEEAEPDFQQLAYFRTRINLRNGLQESMVSKNDVLDVDDEDKEMVSIILSRPLVYVQPMALDKAVLVWINYKNAYEYWNEQRANLNKEVLQATQQVFDNFQPVAQSLATSQSLGTLLLQLNVHDFGVCLPLSSQVITFADQTRMFETDLKDALVLTLESTRISACLRGSLVSKAQFQNLCIRFADDFETNLDDWKPRLMDTSIKNLCIVSEGTYEICSRTITFQGQHRDEDSVADAKWILNVSWKMDGFDIHVDTSIGKHISALIKTMTAIAGDEVDDEEDEEEEEGEELENMICDPTEKFDELDGQHPKLLSTSRSIEETMSVSSSRLDQTFDQDETRSAILPKSNSVTLKELNKQRTRNLEKELNEQVKIINDLRQLGASSHTIQQQVQRFHELEAATFNHFKRGVIKKFKRPSDASSKADFKKSRAQSTSTYQEFPPRSETVEKFQKIDEENASERREFTRSRSQTVSALRQNDDSISISSETESSVTPVSSPNVQQLFNSSPSIQSKSVFVSSNSFDQLRPAPGPPVGNLEPKIDFELDVKILFSSGKCVLHTRDQPPKETDVKPPLDSSQPNSMSPLSVQKALLNKSRSGTKLNKFSYQNAGRRDFFQPAGINPDFTVFLIPGLDIKLHYNSKCINAQAADDSDKDKETINFKNPSSKDKNSKSTSTTSPKEMQNSSNSLNRQKSSKKALLFAWITLSSIPDEIFISPHILDFFEEALKPIPITVSGPNSANATLSSMQSQKHALLVSSASAKLSDRKEESSEDDRPSQYVYYASFPVDVVVFFHFQPTIIRLGCLPVSRVECLIHLPSIDLVMSSKKSEFGEIPLPNSSSTSLNKAIRNMNKTMSSESAPGSVTTGGGLSITGCLADFSLYIFHPYGGQNKNKTSVGDRKQPAYSNAERKDSLSLQVEFIKINISRSRKVDLAEALNQSISFSAVCDIGTATFKYDVRRLNEILAFPKAWYRKSIWKKIFIGESTVNAIFSDDEDETLNEQEKMFCGDSTSSSSCSSSISEDFVQLKKNNSIKKSVDAGPGKPKAHMIAIVNNPWDTLILLTVNFSNFNISMNMGNVMGNTTWLTRNLMCDGSIYIDSQGHRKFRFGVGLNKSTLDAKGGIVGGSVELSDIRSEINIFEHPNQAPEHQINVSLHTIECRVDYMTTSILMARISDLNASFHDEWQMITETQVCISGPNVQTRRPSSIHMHGCLKWDQFQVLMSKSTSPDFIKILAKLEEFFNQQFHSSKRVFDSLHPPGKSSLSNSDSLRSKSSRKVQSVNSSATNLQQSDLIDGDDVKFPVTVSHHRHWQKALKFITGVHTDIRVLPTYPVAIVLGGTVEVRAQNISLACFHGVNFRAKSWAIFSLRQPSITFTTDAQRAAVSDGVRSSQRTIADGFDIEVIQKLSLQLGHDMADPHEGGSGLNNRTTMATVSKISRTVAFPPQFRNLHEWFNYAFAANEIDDVNRFPLLSTDCTEFDVYGVPIESLTSTPSQIRHQGVDRRTKSASEFQFKEEMIFAFPKMLIELKTEHLQSVVQPLLTEPKPKVLCSFVSSFDDHIYVAVDAEAFFFLHDLISSYINESSSNIAKDDAEKAKKDAEAGVSKDGIKDKKKSEDEPTNDYRDFICKIWHLEPTVRLHSWASKNLDPYGVDYILQRLGFSQARTTIPKWIQRSTMDACDKLVSLFVYQMIRKNQEENSGNNSSS